MSWKVYLWGKFSGIIESNYSWASEYWAKKPYAKLVMEQS